MGGLGDCWEESCPGVQGCPGEGGGRLRPRSLQMDVSYKEGLSRPVFSSNGFPWGRRLQALEVSLASHILALYYLHHVLYFLYFYRCDIGGLTDLEEFPSQDQPVPRGCKQLACLLVHAVLMQAHQSRAHTPAYLLSTLGVTIHHPYSPPGWVPGRDSPCVPEPSDPIPTGQPKACLPCLRGSFLQGEGSCHSALFSPCFEPTLVLPLWCGSPLPLGSVRITSHLCNGSGLLCCWPWHT